MATILLRLKQDSPSRLFSTILYSLLFLFTLLITGCTPPKPSAQQINSKATPIKKKAEPRKGIPTETDTASDAKQFRLGLSTQVLLVGVVQQKTEA